MFNHDYTNDLLLKKFNVKSLKGFGVSELRNALISAGVILHYLNETHHHKTQHILSVNRIVPSGVQSILMMTSGSSWVPGQLRVRFAAHDSL